MKVIIDCDPGIDDVYAIAVAMLRDDVDILAITIANGNTAVENGAINAKLALNTLFPHKKVPPIYLGSKQAISKCEEEPFLFFHNDGLGGTHEILYKNEIHSFKEAFLSEKTSIDAPHAANKIVELVNKHPNEVVILALAPLTNLALALRLCHNPVDFTGRIKRLLIMGGNEPLGFSSEPLIDRVLNYPEFNFKFDPLAAKIVLDEYSCPISIYTYDWSLRAFDVKTSVLKEEFDKYTVKSKRCEFLEKIGIPHRLSTCLPEIFYSCDLSTMIALFHGEQCKAVYKKIDNATVLAENYKQDGLLVARKDSQSRAFNQNVDLCISMDSEAAYGVFKTYIAELARLDNTTSHDNSRFPQPQHEYSDISTKQSS